MTLKMNFDGPEYIPVFDEARLSGQNKRVFDCMKDQVWRTLGEIHNNLIYGDTEASISAQLRHLRKPRFGSHTVENRRRTSTGLFEYRLTPNPQDNKQDILNQRQALVTRSFELVSDLSCLGLSSRTRSNLQLEQVKVVRQIKSLTKILKKL